MLKTIIKHSLRSFSRKKGYFFINLLGLSLGLASSLLISTYVFHELSYDRFNKKSDRIYKLILNGKIGEQEVLVTSTASVIAPTMHRDFPEIEEFCRLNSWGTTNIKYKDQNFEERRLIAADSSFFRVFTFPLIHGNINEVLNKPYTAVISESVATKIFGNENPIDKKIQVGTDQSLYTVSGVMEEVPENSHFDANVIISFMTNPRSREDTWLNNSFDTYFLLNPNARPESVEEKIPPMVIENVGPEIQQYFGSTFEEFESTGNKYEFYLQPLLKIHLDPSIDQPFKQASDPKYLIIFGSVALLIIIIAAINFMNLSTAQAARRSREVGMKKVAGSTKSMLVNQFLSEAIILALLSLVVAIIMVKISLPYFNDLLNASFGLELLSSWYVIPVLIAVTLLIGFMAG
ncbi:MAG: ABC transporter permease, partial [Bacteroidales bacterium]|nr:ABC transporter permease [Bacteroidales bacterium]